MNASRFFGREVCAVPTCPVLVGCAHPNGRESDAPEVTR